MIKCKKVCSAAMYANGCQLTTTIKIIIII